MNEITLGPTTPMSADLLGATLPAAAAAGKGRDAAALDKVARDFESIFVHRLMEEMRRTVPESGLLESGTSDQMQSLFWFHLAQDVGTKGGLGLAQQLARQLKQAAGSPDAPATEATHDALRG